MERYAFDLHLHSCLSPCGGEDNTPANLAGMCALAGLEVAALTDHNTCGNCAAFCRAAERYGLLALPGMELTTAEEAHVVCLFPGLEEAGAFSALVREKLPPIPNNPAVFGPQLYLDEKDRPLGEETAFLAGAAAIEDEDYFQSCCRTIRDNRAWLTGRLEELGFSVLPSQTNFVFAKSGKISGGALYRGLKERGVLVRWWAGSGRIEDFVRITVGSMEQLKILVEQIAALLEKR